jgi:hypothetical protein
VNRLTTWGEVLDNLQSLGRDDELAFGARHGSKEER